MATEARKFCARWFRNHPCPGLLVLAGQTGCGKTHTARRIADFARRASFSAYENGQWGTKVPSVDFVYWPEFVDKIRAGQAGQMRDAFESDLLVLDDLGAADDPFRIGTDKLCQVLTMREKRFTVATTNIEPAAWEQSFDRRIADRLLRNSVVVDLTQVPSYTLRG
jgi:DNA replication protein DnaC